MKYKSRVFWKSTRVLSLSIVDESMMRDYPSTPFGGPKSTVVEYIGDLYVCAFCTELPKLRQLALMPIWPIAKQKSIARNSIAIARNSTLVERWQSPKRPVLRKAQLRKARRSKSFENQNMLFQKRKKNRLQRWPRIGPSPVDRPSILRQRPHWLREAYCKILATETTFIWPAMLSLVPIWPRKRENIF
jgi:hypothetical protein